MKTYEPKTKCRTCNGKGKVYSSVYNNEKGCWACAGSGDAEVAARLLEETRRVSCLREETPEEAAEAMRKIKEYNDWLDGEREDVRRVRWMD